MCECAWACTCNSHTRTWQHIRASSFCFFVLLDGPGDQAQDLVYDRQVLYQWAMPSSPEFLILEYISLSINVMHLKDRYYVFNWLALKKKNTNCRIFLYFQELHQCFYSLFLEGTAKSESDPVTLGLLALPASEAGSRVSRASLGLPLWLRLALNTWPSWLVSPVLGL